VVVVELRQQNVAGPFGLDVAPPDVTPPAVVGVYVQGSAWSELFTYWTVDTETEEGGFAVPATGTSRTVPWTNADTIVVHFSEDVHIGADDLRVTGLHGDYAVVDFSYNRARLAATWRLAAPFRADRVRIQIDGDAPGGVADTSGNLLHGAAGGTAPGDHVRTFNTLPGDVNGDGRVNALDLALVKRRLNIAAGTNANYRPFCDMDGDTRINALDLATVRSKLAATLPPTPAIAAGIMVRRAGTTRDLYGTQPILPP
jgi:hypothetical protein